MIKKTILFLLFFPVLDFAQDSTVTKTSKNLLSEKELFDFKKESLFLEVSTIKDFHISSYNLKWQARFLLATLSAGFLAICATSKEFRALKFFKRLRGNRMFFAFVILFLLLFFFYDCHLTHYWSSVTNRVDKIGEDLRELHKKKTYEELIAVNVFDSIQKSRKREFDNLSQFQVWGRKLSVAWALDFFLFYSITGIMWLVGWLIIQKNE